MKKFKKLIASAMSLAIACTAVPMTASMTTSAATSITFMRGDVDGDGSVGLSDLTLFTRYLNGGLSVTPDSFTRMDSIANKIIDFQDYNRILKYVTGEATSISTTKTVYSEINDETRRYYKHVYSDTNPLTSYTTYTLSSPNDTTYTAPRSLYGNYQDPNNLNTVEVTFYGGCGSGFIVDDHVIATAAHNVYDVKTNSFVEDLGVNIYSATGMTPLRPKCNAVSVHVPELFITSPSGIQDNYDYALIYVSEDLSENGVWSLGYITDEFMSTNSSITNSGFTLYGDASPQYNRYYSTGKIIDFTEGGYLKKYKINSDATGSGGKSGGPTYYESVYDGKIIKTAIGIHTAGSVGDAWATRITPTLVRFYLNNSNI